ncbi:MAG: DUF59 domain-containing protein [Alphaproteobacteria bacterium]
MKIVIHTPDDLAANDGRVAADAGLREKVIHALRGVMDPELPVNLYDLGLIYELTLNQQPPPTLPSEALAKEGAHVAITMTLTAPNCPVAGEMPLMVQRAVKAVPGISACEVKLVFDPPWDKSRLSDAARLELGMM